MVPKVLHQLVLCIELVSPNSNTKLLNREHNFPQTSLFVSIIFPIDFFAVTSTDIANQSGADRALGVRKLYNYCLFLNPQINSKLI